MAIKVRIDGALEWDEKEHQHWARCPGGALLSVEVEVTVAHGADSDERPRCLLSYITAPGSHPGELPTDIKLEGPAEGSASAASDRDRRVWSGTRAIRSPKFYPLCVRIEVRPAYDRPRTHTLFLIPNASYKASIALALSSLCVGLAALIGGVPSPRVTLLQAGLALSAVGLLAGILSFASKAIRTLGLGRLPFFGLVLLPRSIVACAAWFGLLAWVLGSHVVMIKNETDRAISFEFPWRRAEPDKVGEKGSISILPEDSIVLRLDPLQYLDPRDRLLPLCVTLVGDGPTPRDPCAPATVGPPAPERGWLSPPEIHVRCGGRWNDLDGRSVAAFDAGKVRVEGDHVWLHGACEGLRDPIAVWYRGDAVGTAFHRVSYPWQQSTLRDAGKLWVTAVEDGVAGDHGVMLISRIPEDGDAHDGAHHHAEAQVDGAHETASESAFPSNTLLETRVVVGRERLAHGEVWAMAGLSTHASDPLRLDIAERVSSPDGPVPPGAQLECQRTFGSTTGLRATRLGVSGVHGWITELLHGTVAGGTQSTWRLLGASGASVTAPWICEAFDGHEPPVARSDESSAATLRIVTEARAYEQSGLHAVILPAVLEPHQIGIELRQPGVAAPIELGTLTCNLDTNAADTIAIGRVDLDDRRGATVRSLDVTVVLSSSRFETSTWTEKNRSPDANGRHWIWMCWRRDTQHVGDLDVLARASHGKEAISGRWNVEEARVVLDGIAQVTCYHDSTTDDFARKPPKGVQLSPRRPQSDYEQYPKSRTCDFVVPFSRGPR